MSHLLGTLSFSLSQGDGFVVDLHRVTLQNLVKARKELERIIRSHLRVNVISDVVQSVSTPDTVSALE